MAAAKNGKSILVIDDDAMARDIYKAILEEAGFTVTLAQDGEAGLSACMRSRFDGVVVDIFMPGMSGIDVIKALQSEPRKTPILAVSGGQDGSHPLQLATTLGAKKVLDKGFEHADFVAAVKELTGVK